MSDRMERLDRLDAYIAEGRLLRRRWTDTDAEGRHRHVIGLINYNNRYEWADCVRYR